MSAGKPHERSRHSAIEQRRSARKRFGRFSSGCSDFERCSFTRLRPCATAALVLGPALARRPVRFETENLTLDPLPVLHRLNPHAAGPATTPAAIGAPILATAFVRLLPPAFRSFLYFAAPTAALPAGPAARPAAKPAPAQPPAFASFFVRDGRCFTSR